MTKAQRLEDAERIQERRWLLWQNHECARSDTLAGRVAGKVGWNLNVVSARQQLGSRVWSPG